MLFFRQTLLSVCLVVLCVSAFAQPMAGADNVSMSEDDPPLTFSVLGNDDDPSTFDIDPATVDFDPLTPAPDQGPMTVTGGTISVNNSGDVTFTPDPDYNGVVVVPYAVSNNESPAQISPSADITITVTSVNDEPTIDPVGPITIAEDAGAGTGPIDLVIADVETPVAMLTLSATSDNSAVANAGSFAFSGNELIIT